MYCSLEKEALESNLFDVQRQLAQLEARREQLESEGQALLLAKETLTGTRGWGLGELGGAGGVGQCRFLPGLQSCKDLGFHSAGGSG